MNILICSDSFKDSLTSSEVSFIISQYLLKKFPNAEIKCVELADGGEGSLNALKQVENGEVITHPAVDSLLRPIKSNFLLNSKSKHAIIELAQTCGITLLAKSERNCFNTSTYGVGLQIQKALEYGVHSIDLLVGGSATNDLGIGMASVISYDFYKHKNLIPNPRGRDMLYITNIEPSSTWNNRIKFRVVTDVDNILLGPNGATSIYGSQKGANKSELDELENGAKNIVQILKSKDETNHHLKNGAGAAGGAGYGAMAFFGATKLSGIDYMIETLGLVQKVKKADLVITGEGKIDGQTINGKLVSGVCKLARSVNKTIVGVCAINELTESESQKLGLSAVYSMYDKPPQEILKSDSEKQLINITKQIINAHL